MKQSYIVQLLSQWLPRSVAPNGHFRVVRRIAEKCLGFYDGELQCKNKCAQVEKHTAQRTCSSQAVTPPRCAVTQGPAFDMNHLPEHEQRIRPST